MSDSNIETKAELAFVAHLNTIASRIAGVTIHPCVDQSTLPAPCIVANATGANEHIPFSGQYAVDVEIEVISQNDDTSADTHRSRVAVVRDELSCDWIGASLNTYVPNFTVAGAVSTWGVILQKSQQSIRDTRWVTTIPLLVHCRPS